MGLDTRKSIARFDAVDEVRYVVFRLGTEKFGARIEHLKEVLLIKNITAVPRAQEFVLGVINLRGVVCTIVDLGRRLNVRREEGETEKLAAAESRNAIIVEIGKNILGMAVDHVESITSIPVDVIESNLDMIKKEINVPFLAGVAKMENGEIIILLDISIIFSEYEVGELADLAEKKREDRGSLEEELALSQEDMQRLDLAYDDIDEIAAKAPREAKSPKEPTVADVAPIEKAETVTPLISKKELEEAAVKQKPPKEPAKAEKDPAPKEKPAKALFTKEKPKEPALKPETPEEPEKAKKDPAPKEKPAKGKKPSKTKPSEPKKPSKTEKEASKTTDMPIISPNLSKKELKKLSSDDLVKMAEDRDIPNVKGKKKKDLVKLLAETFKEE